MFYEHSSSSLKSCEVLSHKELLESSFSQTTCSHHVNKWPSRSVWECHNELLLCLMAEYFESGYSIMMSDVGWILTLIGWMVFFGVTWWCTTCPNLCMGVYLDVNSWSSGNWLSVAFFNLTKLQVNISTKTWISCDYWMSKLL